MKNKRKMSFKSILFLLFFIILLSSISFYYLRSHYEYSKWIKRCEKAETLQEKINALDRAILIRNRDHRLYAFRARLYSDIFDFVSALKNINRAIKLNPEESIYYQARAKINEYLNKDKDEIEIDKEIAKKLKLFETGLFNEGGLFRRDVKKGFNTDTVVPWLVSFLLPTAIILMLQFGIPAFIDPGSPTNLSFCYILAFLFNISAIFVLINSSPHISLSIMIIILYGILILHLFFEMKSIVLKLLQEPPLSHWICASCQTENTNQHIQCWKCQKPVENQLKTS